MNNLFPSVTSKTHTFFGPVVKTQNLANNSENHLKICNSTSKTSVSNQGSFFFYNNRAALDLAVISVLLIFLFLLGTNTGITGFVTAEFEDIQLINISLNSSGIILLSLEGSPSQITLNGQHAGETEIKIDEKPFYHGINEQTFTQTQYFTDLSENITISITLNDTILYLDKIKYTYSKEILNQEPYWNHNSTVFEIQRGEILKLDLNSYFTDDNNLTYLAVGVSNITLELYDSSLIITPDSSFIGDRKITIIASNEYNIVEQEITLHIVESGITETIVEEINVSRENVTTTITEVNITTNITKTNINDTDATSITSETHIRIINKLIGKKTQDEQEYELYFVNKSLTNESLILEFYHDFNTALPVFVSGDDVSYNLSQTNAEPNETITLVVELQEGIIPLFELHVGINSEIYEFGKKIPNVKLKNKELKTKKQKNNSEETEWYEIIDRNDELLDIRIVKANSTVYIKGVNATDINGIFNWITNSVLTTEFFAAEPISMEEAVITLMRDQTKDVNKVFECADFNLSSQTCPSSWTAINIPLIKTAQNITFTVNHFSGYGGGSIDIINVQSYPTLYGNWTVEFNTSGTANLTITAVNTTWSSSNEDNDLKFLELKCGDTALNYSWINDSVFVENYNCSSLGYEVSKVLTAQKHILRFTFGDDAEYAYNDVPVQQTPLAGAHEATNLYKDSSLISYWQFEGESNRTGIAVDSVGGNNGTINGAIYTYDGGIGSAYEFDGVNNYINATIGLSNDTYSVSFWFNSFDTNLNTRPIYGADGLADERIVFAISSTVSVNTDYSIGIFSKGSVKNNTWHHLTLTVDYPNQLAVVYLDGVDLGNDTSFSQDPGGNLVIEIGRRTTSYWNGSIDEVMIYNRSLSASEVYELYRHGNVSTASNVTTAQDLGASSVNSTDADNDDTKSIFNWYKDGKSITLLNMPFEGNLDNTSRTRDYSAYGNNGTINGATWNSTGGVDGKGAYEFNGKDDFINTTYITKHNGDFSFSVWFKSNSSARQIIISNYKAIYNGWYLDIYNSDSKSRFYIYNGTNPIYFGTDSDIPKNEWVHLAGTFDNTTKRIELYFNGNLDGNKTLPSEYIISDNSLIIGKLHTHNLPFNGTIDEVMIFNHTLTPEQIRALYNRETNRIVSNETNRGETWFAEVTVNDGVQDGATLTTNNVTIVNAKPQHYSTPMLNSTSGTNYTNENLTVHYETIDADSNSIKNITTWYLNGSSIMVLNMPFEADGNQNATDYSGFGNDGTPSGSPYWNATGGYDGKGAYMFDGKTSYINITNDASLQIQKHITIEAWIKTNSSTNQCIVDKYGSTDYGPLFYILSTGNFHFFAYNGTALINEVSSTFDVIDNEWHHVAVTVDDTNGRLIFYADGIAEEETFTSIGNWGTTGNILIGHRNKAADTQFFNGTIDEVHIYNRTLTAEQISAIYENRTDIFVSQETVKSEVWKACVTPNDGTADGAESCSNNMTILNSKPVISLISPTNASRQPVDIYFDWTFTDADSDEQDSYNIVIDDNSDFSSPEINKTGNITDTNHTDTLSQAGIAYYWKVRANDTGGGWSDWSDWSVLYTVTGNHKPSLTVVINSTYLGNGTLENITVYPTSTDEDSDPIKNITTWYMNSTSIMVLNMPFEAWGTNTTGHNESNMTKDYSSFGNNGTAYNGPVWSSSSGFDSKGAYTFDGKDDFINTGTLKNNYSLPWSASAWIKMGPVAVSYGDIISWGHGNDNPWYSWRVYQNKTNHIGFNFYNGSNYYYYSDTDFTSVIDNWHHITIVYDTINVSIYVDNVLEINEIANIQYRTDGFDQTVIGASQLGAIGFFNGSIDDVMIFNRSLSAEQIKMIYQNRTDLIVSEETIAGETWKACVTPNDGKHDGTEVCSDEITILSNSRPYHLSTPVLNSTYLTNYTNENLTVYSNLIDLNGNSIKNITTWYLNGSSIMVLNMPFEADGNQNATDYSSFGNDGTPSGSPYWNATGGYDGKGAYEFDGKDRSILIPDDDSLDGFSEMSVFLWAKQVELDTLNIILKHNLSQTDVNWRIYYSNRNIISTLEGTSCGGVNNIFTENTWHHIGYTWNGTTITLFIDGQNNTRCAKTGVLPNSIGNLSIGGIQRDATKYSFNGTLDEIMIFNRSLTEDQVLALYQNKTDLIVSQETSKSETWKACVTPNDGTANGPELCSNNLTILNTKPVVTLLSPRNLTTEQITNIYFDWSFADTDEDSQDAYNILIDDNIDFSSPEINKTWNLSDTNHTDTLSLTSTAYYWKVRANDTGGGWSDWSDWSVIFTTTTNTPPTVTLTINTTYLGNGTLENITVYPTAADADSDPVKNITTWYMNSSSIMVLNMPFEAWGNNVTHNESNATKDYSSFGNNGTVNGATWSSTAGYDGKGAYEFTKANDYINLDGLEAYNNNNKISIAFWVKGVPEANKRIYCEGSSVSDTPLFTIGTGPTTNTELMIFIRDDAGATKLSVTTPINVINNTWRHIAYVDNGTNYSVYVDGVLNISGNYTRGTLTVDKTTIGAIGRTGYSLDFNGTIDEFMIFNRSLSAEQIKMIYQNKTDLIVSSETQTGETWKACITPNDGKHDGTEVCSDEITILSNSRPYHLSTPVLNSTFGTNYTNENLTVYADLTDLECYDNQTKILTKTGWKYFQDLNKNETVMTLNPETHEKQWQKPTAFQNFKHKGDMYRITTEKGDLLVSPNHQVYARNYESSLINSSVVNTDSSDCCLRCGSLDQIGINNLRASARYAASFGSDNNESAFLRRLLYSSLSTNTTLLFNDSSILLKLLTPDLLINSSLYLYNSTSAKSGAANFSLCFNKILFAAEEGFESANNTLASTINFIYNNPSFSNRLATPLLTFLPISTHHSSNSLSCFSFSNISSFQDNSLVFSTIASRTKPDQFISENSSILCLTSSGIDNVILTIANLQDYVMLKNRRFLAPQKSGISVEKHKNVEVFKSFGLNNKINPKHETTPDLKNYKLTKISEIYEQPNLVFLDSKNNEIKIKKITKEDFNGNIYDVDVKNNIILVKRGNLEVWSGNSNAIKNITTWYLNGSSIMVLNMPFETDGNQNATDYSGFGNDGTPSGSPYWNSTGGFDNKGTYQFDGINDYITLNNWLTEEATFGGSNGSVTVAAWVKPVKATKYNVITRCIGPFDYFSAGITNSGQLRTMVKDVINGVNYWPTSTGTIKSGEWSHVVFILEDRAGYKFYINGQLDKSFANSNIGFADYGANSYIGIGVDSASYFNGTIDDVMVFNRSLSSEQIKALYNNRTDLIVSQETKKSETWKACITPNDGTADGIEVCSNNLTISNSLPVVTLVSPTNLSIQIITDIYFDWTFTDDDEDSQDVYNILIDDNLDFSSPEINYTGNISDTNHTATLSQSDTVYYWKVRANDTGGEGWSDWSTWSALFTITSNTPPTVTLTINTTYLGNGTLENITIYPTSSDVDGDPVKNITNWYMNSTSIALLNMPFEAWGNNRTNHNESNMTKDYSSFGNNGTVNGATWSSTAGYDGKGAYEFDGKDDEIDISAVSANMLSTTGSIVLRARPNASSTSYVFRSQTNTRTYINMFADNRFRFSKGNPEVDYYYEGVNLNEWYHLALTWNLTGNEGTMNSYVNGILKDSRSFTGNATGIVAAIGSSLGGTYFNGSIDEVIIFNRTLSAEQILALNNSRTDLIVSEETIAGETWKACVTPNDGKHDGSEVCSDEITILSNSRPYHLSTPVLNSTYLTNYTNENLTVYANLVDADGNSIKNITTWYLNGSSIMVLNMPFEGDGNQNATDYSSFGNDGTPSGSPYWNSTGGFDGKGVYMFDGKSSYIYKTDTSSLDLTDSITVSVWIYPIEVTDRQVIASKHRAIANQRGYSLEVEANGNVTFIIANVSQSVADTHRAVFSEVISANQWNHIVGTYDGENIKLYINGVLNDTLGQTGSIATNGQDFVIGAYSVKNALFFNGTIDDVMVFNRSLSAEQIKALYENRTDLIVSQETQNKDTWKACVTPNDGTEDGTEQCSNNLTIGYKCGQTLYYDTTLYESLTSSGNCFDIGANDITLDCNGFNITGDDSGSLITIADKKGITIQNCEFLNAEVLVEMDNVNDTLIQNTNFSNIVSGYGFGADIADSRNITFQNAGIISSSGYAGIYYDTVDNLFIYNTTIAMSEEDGGGVLAVYGSGLVISESSLINNDDYSVLTLDIKNVNITYSNLSNNYELILVDTNNSFIAHNTFDRSDMGIIGIVVQKLNIINNSFDTNPEYAIDISGANITLIENNSFTNFDEYGIKTYESNFTTIKNNTFNNGSAGIWAYDILNLTIEQNQFVSCQNKTESTHKDSSSAVRIEAYRAVINDIFVLNNTFNDNQVGVLVWQRSNSTYIANNTFVNNSFGGILSLYGENSFIADNTFVTNNASDLTAAYFSSYKNTTDISTTTERDNFYISLPAGVRVAAWIESMGNGTHTGLVQLNVRNSTGTDMTAHHSSSLVEKYTEASFFRTETADTFNFSVTLSNYIVDLKNYKSTSGTTFPCNYTLYIVPVQKGSIELLMETDSVLSRNIITDPEAIFLFNSSGILINNLTQTAVGKTIRTINSMNTTIKEANLINAEIEMLDYGIINYTNDIYVSERNLSDVIDISWNRTFVNSTYAPEFNKTAVLTIKNLSFGDTPYIYADWDSDRTIDENCQAPVCTAISYVNRTFVFNVTHFSSFQAGDNQAPTHSTPLANAHQQIGARADPSLVSYWQFEHESNKTSIAVDSIGSNNGTLNGGVMFTDEGYIGSAYLFDGKDDWINTTSENLSLTSATNFTVITWIKYAGQNDATPREIIGDYNKNTLTGWHLKVQSGDVFIENYCEVGNVSLKVTSDDAVMDGEWHYLAGIFHSNGTVEAYFDDNYLGSNKSVGCDEVAIGNNSVKIGVQSDPNNERFFNGTIDEVMIFNRTLSSSEVYELFRDGKIYSASNVTADQDLGVASNNSADLDSDSIKFIYNWYRNQTSITVLNMPFEGGSVNGTADGETDGTKDYSGYGNNGTVVNATWNPTGGVDGKGAYEFDGVNNYISYPLRILKNSNNLAISAWFRTTDTDGSIIMEYYNSGKYSYYLNIKDSQVEGCLYNDTSYCAYTSTPDVTSPLTYNDDSWHHAVLNSNGTDVMLYVDGILVNSTNKSVSIGQGNYLAAIGVQGYKLSSGVYPQRAGYFDGYIDEVHIYNRSLSPEQVLALYNLEHNRIASNETRKNETWHAEVTPNDGEGDGNTLRTNNVTIVNERPDLLQVLINATPPLSTFSELTCYALGEDIDDDNPLVAHYNWYNNSVLTLTGITTGITEGQMSLISTLGPGNTTKYETWTCEVKFNDGFINGSIWINASQSIYQISPVLRFEGGVLKLADTNVALKLNEIS